MTPEKIERNFEACGLRVDKVATKLVMALCRDAFNAGLEEMRLRAVAILENEDPQLAEWLRARLSQKEEQEGK